jgi:hypothetical protein
VLFQKEGSNPFKHWQAEADDVCVANEGRAGLNGPFACHMKKKADNLGKGNVRLGLNMERKP